MRRPKFDIDTKSVSEFQADTAELIEQVRTSRRPLVLTQRGRSAAVVLDIATYDAMMEEVELLRDIGESEKQIASGKGVSNRSARAELRGRLSRGAPDHGTR